MLSIGEVEIKHERIPENETDEQRHDRDRQREKREDFNRDLERLYRESAEFVSKETNNKNPHLLAALDKISAFYKRPDEFRSDRSKEALPILTQALALARSLNEPTEKIGERTVALSVAQANTGDRAGAIKICENLFDEAVKAGGTSKAALLALRYLSKHSEDGSWNVNADERKGYLEEALKYKKREVTTAKILRLPGAEIGKRIDEQAQIELKLGDKESALVNMERAFKLDSNLPQSRDFAERLAKIYGEKGQLDQMQDLLHRSIAALDENGLSVRPVSSCVEFAQLATKQGKPEKMKDAARMLEEVNEAIQAREAKGAYIEVLNALNWQAVSTLAWLAPYYEEQKDLVKAERTYMRYENRAHMNNEEGRSHRMAALAGLVRIYTAQGKKAEAKESKDELDFLSRLRQ
jgi:tetratricopeptide (TPR) repeat protein